MGEWLAAYREGHWRVDQGSRAQGGLSRHVAWHSPRFGYLSGRSVMGPHDGWVLAQGEHNQALLCWVREDLLCPR